MSKRHSVPHSKSGSTNVRNALTLDRSLSVPDFHMLRLSRVNACDAACTLAFTSFCELAFTSIFVPRYLADVVALIVMPRTLNFSLPRATLLEMGFDPLLQATTIISSLLTLVFIPNFSNHSITFVAHTSTSSSVSYTRNDNTSSTNATSEMSSLSSSSSDSSLLSLGHNNDESEEEW